MSSEEMRKCLACERLVAVDKDSCDCGYPRFKFEPCAVCRHPMPEKADRCKHCASYQGFIRRHFGLSSTVLSMLVSLGLVLGQLLPRLAAFGNRHSNTVVTFLGGTEEAIKVQVRNTGLSPSVLRGYRLHFDGLGIDDASLALARKDAPATLDFIPAGGDVTIPLTLPGLRSSLPHADLATKIAMQPVTLSIDVQESGRRNSPWPQRIVTFPADSIREFILAKVPEVQSQ